mgnify:CR=1 FL=1
MKRTEIQELFPEAPKESIDKIMSLNGADINAAKAKYRALSNEYAAFSKAMNLPQQRERISIDGRKGVDVSFGKQAEKADVGITAIKTLASGKIENVPIAFGFLRQNAKVISV